LLLLFSSFSTVRAGLHYRASCWVGILCYFVYLCYLHDVKMINI